MKTGWPTALSLRNKKNLVKTSKLEKQDVPVFFPLTASNVEVILNNKEMISQQLMSQKDIKENTKF